MDCQAPLFAHPVLDRYAAREPLTVAARLAVEHAFAGTQIDALFEQARDQTYTRTLLFSTLVEILQTVVTGRHGSVHAALKARAGALPVSITAVYDKLHATEPQVSATLVHGTAARAADLIHATGGAAAPLLPRHRVRVLDGKHLDATERRLQILWQCSAGPLPGFLLVAFDPALGLVTDVVPCPDGHAQERSLTEAWLALVRARDCWLADRNFCTLAILFGIARRAAAFVIRQHANLPVQSYGTRRARGRTATGQLFEQAVTIAHPDGRTLTLRRITVVLDRPTRDGDRELHLLTNLPAADATAATVADRYRDRGSIEAAFAELARWLDAEIKPLGYPQAALFGYCVGLLAFNLVATLRATLRAAHGPAAEADVSGYHLAERLRVAWHGLDVMLDPADWQPYRQQSALDLAPLLLALARRVYVPGITKAKRGLKKPVPPRLRFKGEPHVATQRLLDEAKAGGA